MSAVLIIKSQNEWYNIPVSFRGYPKYVEPILHNYWANQEAVELILDTCGKGVMMVFVQASKEDILDVPFAGASGWHNGEQFDHSPDWCVSPIDPKMSKMVVVDYRNGSQSRCNGLSTLEEALAVISQLHLYVWDGVKWEYRKNVKNNSVFSERRSVWRR